MVLPKESYRIIGAALSVHDFFGCGFSEKVYQDALEVEFKKLNIPYVRELPFKVNYKGVTLNTEFIPDFVCYNEIVVELKAVKTVEDIFKSQAINYGRVGGFKLSILLNFGQRELEKEFFPIYANI